MHDRIIIEVKSEPEILKDLQNRHCVHLFRLPTPLPTLSTNVYFTEKPCPMLIDVPADNPMFLSELNRALESIGYSINNIKIIIVTHPHLDHCGSAGTIAQVSGAEIWATQQTATRMDNFEEKSREEEKFGASLLETSGVPAKYSDGAIRFFRHIRKFGRPAHTSRYLKEGDLISFGTFHLSVRHVPGHTPWCIMLCDESAGIAFTGDFLLKDISSNPLIQRPGDIEPGYRSLKAFTTSFERVLKMKLRLVLPGHGALIDNPSERIRELLRFMKKRRKTIIETMRRNHEQTVFDIIESIFPHLSYDQSFLASSEVLAYLQILEDEHLVSKIGGIPERYTLTEVNLSTR